jgi:hypothetical protein
MRSIERNVQTMAFEKKRSFSHRVTSTLRFLSGILDSFWLFLRGLFSRKHAASKSQQEPRLSAQSFAKSHKLLLEILGIPLALLTIAGFYLSFAPKISVNPAESISWYSPMGTTFTLSNDGALEIHDVVVTPANLHIENDSPQGFSVEGPWEFTNPPDEAKAAMLSPGHKMGLPYPSSFGFTAVNNFTGARFTLIVRYRPAYLWWRKKEIFPFQAIRSNSGTWVWKSVAQ